MKMRALLPIALSLFPCLGAAEVCVAGAFVERPLPAAIQDDCLVIGWVGGPLTRVFGGRVRQVDLERSVGANERGAYFRYDIAVVHSDSRPLPPTAAELDDLGRLLGRQFCNDQGLRAFLSAGASLEFNFVDLASAENSRPFAKVAITECEAT